MAIYHLNAQLISRSQGRSVVACAAYRSAEKIHDQRLDKTHDYTRKQDVAHTQILLPQNAPSWMQDREKLWNHIEAIEKRKDAQLAREIQISLPRELTLEQNKELACEFVQKTFVDQGMVADLSLHMDQGSDGQFQPHVHVLLSTRHVSKEGFGLKNVQWNKKENLLHWRQSWAEIANEHLARHGHDLQIDHRSYVDQQINLEPQHKIGPLAARSRTVRVEDHQRIAYENGQRLLEDPKIALDALTKQQSTFTHQDLSRFVNRHTYDGEQFQAVYDKIKVDIALVSLGTDSKGCERLTTQEMLDLEQNMLKGANDLHKRYHHEVSEHCVTSAIKTRTLSQEQQTALHYITESGDLKCVVGYAGTGKSYMLSAVREIWERSGYRVRGVSLSGIATQNLMQSSGIESRTIASALYRWDRNQDKLTSQDILVIDEAGMLGSRQMERLIREAQQSGAKVVAMGDWQQLQAIEAGASFRAIAEEHHYVELIDIRRQQVSWQKEATIHLAKGRVRDALDQYHHHDHVHFFETQRNAKEQLIDQWNDVRHTYPQESQLIMAYTRQDVKELNDMARVLKRKDGELGIDVSFNVDRGHRDFAEGDRLYFLKRDSSLEVINGTLGTILKIEGKRLHVEIDRDESQAKARSVWVDTEQYKSLEHGYAATVYKAQGVTVDRSYLLTSSYDDAHSTYVGMSRHRKSCDLFSSHELFQHHRDLAYTLGRNRIKDVTLDYTKPHQEYARQRSIEPTTNSLTLDQHFRQHFRDYKARAQCWLDRKYYEAKESFHKQSTQFMDQFRKKHSKQAQEIEKSITPHHEHQALAYVKELQVYNNDDPQHQLSLTKKRLFEEQTEQMVKSTAVINYMHHHLPEVAEQAQKIAYKSQHQREQHQAMQHQQKIQRERSYGLEL